MTISDRLSPSNPSMRQVARLPSPADMQEAAQLISDLAALVDAGRVTVHEQLGEPTRYEAASDLGDAA